MPEINQRWYRFNYTGNENLIKIKSETPSDHHDVIANDRAVYIIRCLEPYSIRYPKKPSPVAYIGSGSVWNRVSNGHSKWMRILHKELGLAFSVYTSLPRVQRSESAYKTVEADLILEFVRQHGTYPLMNKRQERGRKAYSYTEEYIRPLTTHSNETYKCAIEIFEAELSLTIAEE